MERRFGNYSFQYICVHLWFGTPLLPGLRQSRWIRRWFYLDATLRTLFLFLVNISLLNGIITHFWGGNCQTGFASLLKKGSTLREKNLSLPSSCLLEQREQSRSFQNKLHFRSRLTLRKHAYSNILKILPQNYNNFQIKILIFYIFLLKT